MRAVKVSDVSVTIFIWENDNHDISKNLKKKKKVIKLFIALLILIKNIEIFHIYWSFLTLLQIQKNLFSFQSLSSATEKDNTKKQTKMFFPCNDIEENYIKNLSPEEGQGSVLSMGIISN